MLLCDIKPGRDTGQGWYLFTMFLFHSALSSLASGILSLGKHFSVQALEIIKEEREEEAHQNFAYACLTGHNCGNCSFVSLLEDKKSSFNMNSFSRRDRSLGNRVQYTAIWFNYSTMCVTLLDLSLNHSLDLQISYMYEISHTHMHTYVSRLYIHSRTHAYKHTYPHNHIICHPDIFIWLSLMHLKCDMYHRN